MKAAAARSILADVHLWVPVVVLILGVVLLMTLR